MSGVVLRCPTCGTTQNHEGECDACYEDQVRYFCGNHGDGIWLDGASCAACGAKFGDPPKKAPPPPRRSPTVPPRESPRPEAERTPPPPPPPRSRRPRRPRAPVPDAGVAPPTWESSTDTSPPRVETPVTRPSRLSLADIIARMTAEERKHAGYRLEDIATMAKPDIRLPSLPIKGCIFRFAMFLLLLFALAVGGLYLLVGGGIQTFVVDLAQSTGLMSGTPEQTVRGIDAFRRGDLQTAERELAQAAVTYPRSALALLYLARMRTDAGDLRGAADFLETAVAREPGNAIAHRDLGINYLGKARASGGGAVGERVARDYLLDADRHLAAAESLDPDDRATRGYRGCIFAELGAADESARLLALAGDGPWQQCVNGSNRDGERPE